MTGSADRRRRRTAREGRDVCNTDIHNKGLLVFHERREKQDHEEDQEIINVARRITRRRSRRRIRTGGPS